MEQRESNAVLTVLKSMETAEKIIGELYRVFAQKWPEDAAFWEGIALQEDLHAENMVKMASLIAAKPVSFQTGRVFNPIAIETFIKGVRWNIERAKKGEFARKNAFFVARDIEKSIIENKIHEIAKTSDPEYMALVSRIVDDTVVHEQIMNQKIAELK